MAGDFAIERDDIPAEPERGEPGRDLPPEIMTVLCANLDTLEPVEVKVATQIGIDTGRRPEDILDLPLDCLHRDKDGAAVLVYDNAKAHRLPISELKLLAGPRRNPEGRRPITIPMLEERHRAWVRRLDALRTRDGSEFDKARITPYAYRHTYAQRHADAG